ncbi:hypothetical protein PPOLYM_04797 [Paenibacillus polymyxa]|uniref:hypothetical protein n=1 Tax=Paenibacillus polymyxa TaxID=1406 RepID=UPI00094769A9|nr:hypothetical protein [Paenibacillus polymyxa]APQ58045.1 hypothetical protein VK72_04365 [Paenibacillus polymyxa]VUG08362.1 hypothetical protein PPOLYM_04797 [Paenibacillus polymyxa]
MAPTPIQWRISEKGMRLAVFWAAKKLRYSIDRSSMHPRNLPEKLDHKIMGDIATISVMEYLNYIGTNATVYDLIRRDDFKRPDPGWDIVVGLDARRWGSETNDPRNPIGLTTISVRSSRLPSNDTLETAILSRDFKIFKQSTTIAQDLKTDLELQVYYPLESTQIGDLDIGAAEVDMIKSASKFDREPCENIIEKLNVSNRWGECYLVGYDERDSMIAFNNQLKKKSWESKHKGHTKEMWVAPLENGKSMPSIKKFNI